MNDVQSLRHTVWDRKYHEVWIPKYRRKVLYGQLRKELGAVIKELAKQKESDLLLQTPLWNLAEFMRHFNISYTGYFKRRHRRVGHLYQGRYKSILVDKDAYLSIVSRYIQLNPIRVMEVKGLVQMQLEGGWEND
jgi:hypothetical protein